MTRIYTDTQIGKVLRCSARVVDDVAWAVGLGRWFRRKYNAQEAERIMAYYHANYRHGQRLKGGVDPGVEPGGLRSAGHSQTGRPSPDADPQDEAMRRPEDVPASAFRVVARTPTVWPSPSGPRAKPPR